MSVEDRDVLHIALIRLGACERAITWAWNGGYGYDWTRAWEEATIQDRAWIMITRLNFFWSEHITL